MGKPRNTRKYPTYPEIPESKKDTRKYPIIFFDTPTRPEPDPLPGILSNTRPDIEKPYPLGTDPGWASKSPIPISVVDQEVRFLILRHRSNSHLSEVRILYRVIFSCPFFPVTYRPILNRFRGVPVKKNTLRDRKVIILHLKAFNELSLSKLVFFLLPSKN